jgi:hypothetical protein
MPSARAARLKLMNCATFTKTAMSFKSAIIRIFPFLEKSIQIFLSYRQSYARDFLGADHKDST